MIARLRRVFRWAVGLFLLAAAFLAVWFAGAILTDRPVDYAAIVDHFKYGSIGSEPGVSLLQPVGGVLPPYWVFK